MPSRTDGWWEFERAKFIDGQVASISRPGDLVLDVGCGRARLLSTDVMSNRVIVRVDSHVWDEWSDGTDRFVCAAADALPFRDGAFDVVGSFDVLEHLANPEVSLSEQRRVIRDDGDVVIAVPADPRLWSAHDEIVGHHRRYEPDTLCALARACDLVAVRSTHLFAFLWLPAWLSRRSTTRTSEPGNGSSIGARVVRSVIAGLARTERAMLRRLDLPFGTSLWMRCRRQ